MFGLPRARAIHPDKHVALSRLVRKPARKKPDTRTRAAQASHLITNLAYELHSNRQRRYLPAGKKR